MFALKDDKWGVFVDGVSWGDSKVNLDPSVPKVDPDHSIERYPAGIDNDIAADWRDQPNPIPGQIDPSTPTPTPTPTPTATLIPSPLPPLIINEIHADPAGDLRGDANGDGFRDQSADEFVELVNTTHTDMILAVERSPMQLASGILFPSALRSKQVVLCSFSAAAHLSEILAALRCKLFRAVRWLSTTMVIPLP